MASPNKKKAFLMRVDPQLWAELERLAEVELRSVNGQIEYLLREAVNKRQGKTLMPYAAPQKVTRIERRAGDVAQRNR